jgi:diguanylate cyclase (GGDEF)-like protein
VRFLELPPLAQKLGLPDGKLAALGDQMLREWADWSALLEIPVHEVAPFSRLEASTASVATPPRSALDTLDVLVVDDDPTVCLLLQKLLTGAGHRVTVARNGREGLVQALQSQPQLIITDLLMPQQDGLQLIRSLRQSDLGRSIYIIVLTILDDDDKLAEAFDLGADDYITKPVDAKLLRARLKASMRIIGEQQVLRHEQEELRRCLLEVSIANQRAQEASLTDVLTGLYNRRYAMQRLVQEWAEAERGKRPLSVLALDIDHFKAVNDNHGHDVGDAVLRQFSDILRSLARVADVVCRFGGEEFLIIAPDTPADGALRLAERVRAAVQRKVLVVKDISLQMTVSIGVAEKAPSHTSTDQLIKAGDEALYAAKLGGRNRVEKA